jgi:hypothetical protein
MTSNQATEMQPNDDRRQWARVLAWSVAVVVTFVVVAGAVLFVTAREEGSKTVRTIATTTLPRQTSAPTTATTSTTAPPSVDESSAVWPDVASTTRYSDPVAAARGFAVDFVGFPSPLVGQFRQGDSRSGEVDVRPRAGAPVTTVLVRQIGSGDTWWVLGASTAHIALTEPAALATISSPVRLRGSSTAFEATVSTEVRQDGSVTPLGRGFVMGGANGVFAPFDGMLAYSQPNAASGAVVLYTRSMENGQVWEATVIPVRFSR